MTVKQTIKMIVWAALVLAKAICGPPSLVQFKNIFIKELK